MLRSILEKSSSLSPSPDIEPICLSMSLRKSSSEEATSDWMVVLESCKRFMVRFMVSAKEAPAAAVGDVVDDEDPAAAPGVADAAADDGGGDDDGGAVAAASLNSFTNVSNCCCNSGYVNLPHLLIPIS